MKKSQEEIRREAKAYLARIRKTISDSKNLIESARLRVAETDRFLESQGLTREEVERFSYTPEQQALVNAELVRQGFAPLAEIEESRQDVSMPVASEPVKPESLASVASANFTAGDGDGAVENRKRKFNVMMQQFRM